MRAEVLFVNTKEVPMKWGTKNAINLPAAGLPGGMPIRAFGTYNCYVADDMVLIERIAGIKKQFSVDEVRERYGYGSLQRALVRTDPALGGIDPTSHTIHPVGFVHGG